MVDYLVNKKTGKRLTLKETKKLKKEGIYEENTIKRSEYLKLHNINTKPKKSKKQRKIESLKKNDRGKYYYKRYTRPSHKLNALPSGFKIADKNYDTVPTNSNDDILFEVYGIHIWSGKKLEPHRRVFKFKATKFTKGIKYLQKGIECTVENKKGFSKIMVVKIVKPRSKKRIEEVSRLKPVIDVSKLIWQYELFDYQNNNYDYGKVVNERIKDVMANNTSQMIDIAKLNKHIKEVNKNYHAILINGKARHGAQLFKVVNLENNDLIADVTSNGDLYLNNKYSDKHSVMSAIVSFFTSNTKVDERYVY